MRSLTPGWRSCRVGWGLVVAIIGDSGNSGVGVGELLVLVVLGGAFRGALHGFLVCPLGIWVDG